MSRAAGRSAEDTKKLLLRHAAQIISKNGTAAPLSEIAQAAGVSKGGLLYHFPTKEALLSGLARDLMSQFRNEVQNAVTQEPGHAPGRLNRAYIRASFAELAEIADQRDYVALVAHLMFEPGLTDIAQQDAQQWRDELLDDGLPADTVHLIIAATDGSNSAPLLGAVLNEADCKSLEANLLAMTWTRV